MRCTKVFSQNLRAYLDGFRRIANHGGTSSSKNFSTLQLLFLIAEKQNGTLISVMSESMPHLEKGAIRDLEKILKDENMYDERNINFSDHTYHFRDSVIEFFSADSPGKVTGPRRDILYVNECINVPYIYVEQAELRTNKCIFYDYNPDHVFWIEEKVFQLPDKERKIIKSNYLDNPYLPDSIKHEIEMKAAIDPNFKKIHVDLEFGIAAGLIFPTFNLVDAMPETTKKIYGMDFGFTNDPTTLIDIRVNNGQLWLDEMLYRRQMTNWDIIRELQELGLGRRDHIVADSAEPKSIAEIEQGGFFVTGADKSGDSIRIGIDRIKSYPVINITKRSVNLIKEMRNYKWKVNKTTGESMNIPIDTYNHCIDPTRYGLVELSDGGITAPKAYWR